MCSVDYIQSKEYIVQYSIHKIFEDAFPYAKVPPNARILPNLNMISTPLWLLFYIHCD